MMHPDKRNGLRLIRTGPVHEVGARVRVARTGQTHEVIERRTASESGKPEDHYRLDNGSWYWAHELIAT